MLLLLIINVIAIHNNNKCYSNVCTMDLNSVHGLINARGPTHDGELFQILGPGFLDEQ